MAFNSYEEFHGDAQYLNMAGNTNLEHTLGRMVTATAKGAGLDLILPDATRFTHTGGPIFEIFNIGGSHSIDVVDQSSGLIASIAPGFSGEVLLLDNSDADGDWRIETSAGNFPDESTALVSSSAGGSGSGTGATGSGYFSTGQQASTPIGISESNV